MEILGSTGRVVACMVGLIGSFSVGLSGCSSRPSSAATALCSATKQEVDAPPNELVAINGSLVNNGEHSGDAGLDAAAIQFARVSTSADAGATKAANLKIEAACRRLGIW
jgi:hypothetical protein